MLVSHNIVDAGRGAAAAPSIAPKDAEMTPQAFQASLHDSLKKLQGSADGPRGGIRVDNPTAPPVIPDTVIPESNVPSASDAVDVKPAVPVDDANVAKAEDKVDETTFTAEKADVSPVVPTEIEHPIPAIDVDRKKIVSCKEKVEIESKIERGTPKEKKELIHNAPADVIPQQTPLLAPQIAKTPEAVPVENPAPDVNASEADSAAEGSKVKGAAMGKAKSALPPQVKESPKAEKVVAGSEIVSTPVLPVHELTSRLAAIPVGADRPEGFLKQSFGSTPAQAAEVKPDVQAALDRASFTQSLETHSLRTFGDHKQGIEVAVPVQGSEQVQLRAVVDQEGKVHATVTTQTEASHHELSGAVQSITNFLQAESVRVDSITVAHTQMESGFNFDETGSSPMSQQQQKKRDEAQNFANGLEGTRRDSIGRLPQDFSGTPAALAAWAQRDSHRTISVRA